MNYPAPHEGVKGVDRNDTLLNLDDAHIPTRDLIRGLARHLRTATLVGSPAPVVGRMNDRLRSPKVGDLVVEESTIYRTGADDSAIKGLGILLEKRIEHGMDDEAWAEYKKANVGYYNEDDRGREMVWYIQYGSNAEAICRWTNCSFQVIPWATEQFAVLAGERDGDATVFTKESLMGSFADSGFDIRWPGKDK